MKTAIKVITAIALLGIAVGGCALDSRNILIPAVMIMAGLTWFFLRIGITKWHTTL